MTSTQLSTLLKSSKVAAINQVAIDGLDKGVTGKSIGNKSKVEHKQMAHIISVLEKHGIKYKLEYRFDKVRKFRFDVAIPSLMLAVEYEGVGSEVSRHTTRKGYAKDCEKYTLAAVNGWRVLRYTYKDYLNFEQDLLIIHEYQK